MSDFFPWQDIYEGNVFPSGIFEFEIEALEDGFAGTGKRMPKGRFRCLGPDQLKGMAYFENFVVGTEETPEDFVAGTFGAKALKAIFKAAQVPQATSFEELSKNSIGNRLLIHVNKFIQTKGEYAGREENNVVAYYKVGEREVGLTESKGGASVTPGKSSAKMPTSASTVTPTKKKATLPCAVCGKQIPKDGYAEHVENCKG